MSASRASDRCNAIGIDAQAFCIRTHPSHYCLAVEDCSWELRFSSETIIDIRYDIADARQTLLSLPESLSASTDPTATMDQNNARENFLVVDSKPVGVNFTFPESCVGNVGFDLEFSGIYIARETKCGTCNGEDSEKRRLHNFVPQLLQNRALGS
jgi:hypothetical protein